MSWLVRPIPNLLLLWTTVYLVAWILRGNSAGTVADSSVNSRRLLLCQFDNYLNPDPHSIFDIYWFVIFWVGCMQGLVYVHCSSLTRHYFLPDTLRAVVTWTSDKTLTGNDYQQLEDVNRANSEIHVNSINIDIMNGSANQPSLSLFLCGGCITTVPES